MVSENVNSKKCAPELIFFNDKKMRKIGIIFDVSRKLTLILALFDTSPFTQFSKFNNFLWVCWFLGKDLSNFVPPAWKIHNLYCHRVHIEFSTKRKVTNFVLNHQLCLFSFRKSLIFINSKSFIKHANLC